jgi:putative membrane protein
MALGCGASLMAQDTGNSMAADKMFVMQADEGNSAEIAASQLALRKSKNPEVKAYAQQMITDHMKLRSDMAALATQMGVTTPQPLNQTHVAESKRLMALSGKQFDMEYIKAMDQDHHKTVGMFQNEIATTQNDQVKTAAQQGLPVIQQHTEMADQLSQKMGTPVAPTPGQ